MNAPRLSIITVTFNRAVLLEEAIRSVHSQWDPRIEHWIIDGGSTDGTKEMLSRWPHLRVLSEADHGIYDAFNKGVHLADGEFLLFLNSDDLIAPGAIESLLAIISQDVADLITGACDFFTVDSNGRVEVIRKEEPAGALRFSFRGLLRGVPAINARAFRKSFVTRVGSFDTSYRIASDRDFLLRACALSPRTKAIDALVYRYRSHDDSLTVHDSERNARLIREEHVRMAESLLHVLTDHRDATNELVSLHRRESASLAIDYLTAGDAASFHRFAVRGLRVSLLWPFTAMRRMVGHLLGRSSGYRLPPQNG